MALICSLAAQRVSAATMYCANCSTVVQQMLEGVTSVNQLNILQNSYSNAMNQTAQQIAMVQNMMQNTARLATGQQTQYANQLTQLAQLTNQLNTQRGEYSQIAQVYQGLFPSQSNMNSLATSSNPTAANQQYQALSQQMTQEVDDRTMATYQVSAKQLQDLQNAGALENHINGLLQTPDGQMQAVQAGNQLASLQLTEQRQLRELLATQAQAQAAAQAERDKKDQIKRSWWQRATRNSQIDYSGFDKPLP
jgi:P-type conjugative transfer protein TrbJ